METAGNAPLGARATSHTWAGARMYFADSGFSSIVGLVLGFIVGFSGLAPTAMAAAGITSAIGIIVGLAISLYIAFMLYRKYSQSVTALVSMTATGLFFWLLGTYATWANGATDMTQNWIILGAQVVVYILGWYVAKTYTSLTVWFPGEKTVWVFAVIGMIAAALGFLGALGSLF